MGAAGGGGSGASSLVHSPVSSVSQYFEAGSDDEFFETRSHVSSRMDEDTASVISESMADQRGVLEEWQPDGYRYMYYIRYCLIIVYFPWSDK